MNPLSIIRTLFFSAMLLIMSLSQINAQSFKDPTSYMNFIGEQNREISKDFLSYTSAAAHSRSARKIESKRKNLMLTIREGKKKVASMPPYKGDKSLRDSVYAFLTLTYHILNDDYAKIVNMEEVAEQSYDEMEAYLLAHELANQKSNKAFKQLKATQAAFAATHNVKIIDTVDELDRKLEKASNVNAYHRTVYLLFFKSYKQEGYLLDAFQKKDINAIEQNNNTLKKYSEEALQKLDTFPAIYNDRLLVVACRQMQEFYLKEVNETQSILDYYVKEDNFKKLQKALDAKKQSERTKEDIDNFNKAVAEMNKEVNNYNALNTRLYSNRSKLLNNWNTTSQSFLAKHTPRYR